MVLLLALVQVVLVRSEISVQPLSVSVPKLGGLIPESGRLLWEGKLMRAKKTKGVGCQQYSKGQITDSKVHLFCQASGQHPTKKN